jgi:hypothetical protein
MAANDSQMLLVKAAMLIKATRLRIARSRTVLAKLALDGVCRPAAEARVQGPVMRRSSHPPNATSP